MIDRRLPRGEELIPGCLWVLQSGRLDVSPSDDEPLLCQRRRLPPPLYLLSDCPVETALLI